jgi:RimJ/RimL family protein N-acetyltransferase
MLRLLAIAPTVVDTLADPDTFAERTGAALGEVAGLVADVVAQNEAHRATTGAPPEWGGYLAIDEARRQVVGTCAFTGAPDARGEVEIAYFTFPPFEGQGYGAAMAGALVARAAASGAVRLVYAHTLPEPNASTRILARHGFTQTGMAEDPDVGLVWRWERALDGDAPLPALGSAAQ